MALDTPTQTADYLPTTPQDSPPRPPIPSTPVLFMAIELASKQWKIAFSDGGTKEIVRELKHERSIAKLREQLTVVIAQMKRRFGLADDVVVISCMEAGRDGFWPHRLLSEMGLRNVVIDPASVRVNRRSRRAKTDRLDAVMMLADLVRYHGGDTQVWSAVRAPSPDQEDARRLHREIERAKEERTEQSQRIQSILATLGSTATVGDVLKRLDRLVQWDGSTIPPGVRAQLQRAADRYRLVNLQILEMQKEQRAALEAETKTKELRAVECLTWLRGVGLDSAWLLVFEFFSWRKFENRRQVAGAAGLGGTPFNTGQSTREQGISKAGNPMVRTRMVELAWLWLRYQPEHKLSRWFQEKFASAGARRKRAGIVALARRLLIVFWHFAEHGVVPDGAVVRVAKEAA